MFGSTFALDSQDVSFYIAIIKLYHITETNACEKYDDLLSECHLRAIGVKYIAIIFLVIGLEFLQKM
jgi:hypothetical protein